MNLPKRLQLVNSAHVLVYTALLVFSILISLWLDGLITWSIWLVFLPLWIWKVVVMVGATVGIFVWHQQQDARLEHRSAVSFRAMIISTAVHLLLVLFEILVCMRLEHPESFFPWSLVFSPIFFLSLVSTVLCIWAVRNDRNFQTELLSVVNLLQFAFVSVRLDGYIQWNWLLVLIPAWVLLCVFLLLTLYNIIMTSLAVGNMPPHTEQKKLRLQIFISHLIITLGLIIYLILLVEKLEGMMLQYYATIGIPLYICVLTLISLSFASQPANMWWFGLKKDFCQFLLVDACPCLQEYGNIKYKLQFSNRNGNSSSEIQPEEVSVEGAVTSQPISEKRSSKDRTPPITSAALTLIEMPD